MRLLGIIWQLIKKDYIMMIKQHITRRVYLDDEAHDITIVGDLLDHTGFVMNISHITKIIETAYESADLPMEFSFLQQCSSIILYWDKIKHLIHNAEIYSIKRHHVDRLGYDLFIKGDIPMLFETRLFDFCAAHYLHNDALTRNDNHMLFGKCNEVHGHNFTLGVTVQGCFSHKLSDIINTDIIHKFDHTSLNSHDEFEHKIPTTENFTEVIWKILESHIDNLHCISVRETNKNFFQYYGGVPNESATLITE